MKRKFLKNAKQLSSSATAETLQNVTTHIPSLSDILAIRPPISRDVPTERRTTNSAPTPSNIENRAPYLFDGATVRPNTEPAPPSRINAVVADASLSNNDFFSTQHITPTPTPSTTENRSNHIFRGTIDNIQIYPTIPASNNIVIGGVSGRVPRVPTVVKKDTHLAQPVKSTPKPICQLDPSTQLINQNIELT